MARKPFNPDLIPRPSDASPGETDGGGSGPGGTITVSQLTAMVKQAIESSLPRTVHVIGEVSNFKRHSSGHLYFTLKDRSSELSCVMWRSAAGRLKFAPADGLQLIATGSVDVFERAGRYQLYVRKLEPRGVGSLELAFQQLREKLAAEGLFEVTHKKPLPRYPQRIALVTSPTGAAVADLIRTLARRYPCAEVLLYPVRVQGDGAAAEISAAIRKINTRAAELGGVDVMIVGRGGGSLEDLWAFNEEVVARAIYASRIPIISAVGHEVDVSIADLVADVRAATPTAAAEIAVPVREELLADLMAHQSGLTRTMRGRLELAGARVGAVLNRVAYRDPLASVYRRGQVVDELVTRMRHTLARRLFELRNALASHEATVQTIAPHRYLLRTAAAVRDLAERLRWQLTRRLHEADRSVDRCARRLAVASPESDVRRLSERVGRVAESLPVAMGHRLSMMRERIARQERVLGALSYKSVLGRGFSITRTKKRRKVVRSVGELKDRDRVVTELADGEFEADVVNLQQMELFD